jgi:hypothetical protein
MVPQVMRQDAGFSPLHNGPQLGKNGTKIEKSVFFSKTFDTECPQ